MTASRGFAVVDQQQQQRAGERQEDDSFSIVR